MKNKTEKIAPSTASEDKVTVGIDRQTLYKTLDILLWAVLGAASAVVLTRARFIHFGFTTGAVISNVLLVIFGAALVLSVNGILSQFTDNSKVSLISDISVSLILSAVLYYCHLSCLGDRGSVPGLEDSVEGTVLALGGIHLVYSAIVFAIAAFVRKLLTKAKKA